MTPPLLVGYGMLATVKGNTGLNILSRSCPISMTGTNHPTTVPAHPGVTSSELPRKLYCRVPCANQNGLMPNNGCTHAECCNTPAHFQRSFRKSYSKIGWKQAPTWQLYSSPHELAPIPGIRLCLECLRNRSVSSDLF